MFTIIRLTIVFISKILYRKQLDKVIPMF